MDNLRIYNLIILDESGSMSGARKATISGCNETINSCKTAASKEDKTESFVSIYAFQSQGPVKSRYLVKNVPAEACESITEADYDPSGCTPLLDAIGMTLSDLEATCQAHPGSIGSVTIITDGYENSSTRYSREKIASMIARVKELGWNVCFIGANIDVTAVANSMNVENTMSFESDSEGVGEMFARENACRSSYYAKMRAGKSRKVEDLKNLAKGFFNPEEI